MPSGEMEIRPRETGGGSSCTQDMTQGLECKSPMGQLGGTK